MITSVRVGTLFPDPLHHGPLLPIGAQLSTSSHRSADVYTQQAPNLWVGPYNDAMADPFLLLSPLILHRAGDADEVELPPETASEFRWRLRDAALASAERSAINRGPVMSLVNGFGGVEPRFTVGGIVASGTDLQAMPVGSVVYAGHPDHPKMMSVWEITEGGHLTHVWGRARQRQPGQGLTIFSMPNPPVYPEEKPAAQDTLLRIAQRAYRLGRAAQRRNNWCSVFDNALNALGITEELVGTVPGSLFGAGEEVDRRQAAGLPEGTLLYWSWTNRDAVAVYIRDNTSTRSLSRTRRLFGWQDDESSSHERMTVLQLPDEEMFWRVTDTILFHLPDGVLFRSPEMGPGDFTLDADLRSRVELSIWRNYTVTGWPL